VAVAGIVRVLVVAAVFSGIVFYPKALSSPPNPPRDLIETTALQFGLEPRVLRSLVFVESTNRPWVSRPDGSQGLTQIKVTTARFLGFIGSEEELRDPATNLRFGAMYLRRLLDEFGDIRLALDAYNRGPSRAKKSPFKGDWKKHRYVGKVLYVEKPLYTMSKH